MQQETVKREVNIFTANKRYTGNIDLKNHDVRTIDQLNSSNMYWKNPGEKSFDDAILLTEVEVSIINTPKLASFSKLQLRLADIIFFTDKLHTAGDSAEKARAKTLSEKSSDDIARAHLFTEMRGDSFFLVVGTFHGLFKNKTKQRFLPLTETKIYEVMRTGSKWERNEVNVGNDFIGLSTSHIESCTFSDYS